MSGRRVIPTLSPLAIAGGVVLSVAVLVLLQQRGDVYPTPWTLVIAVVVGLVWGIGVPTLVCWMAVRDRD